MVLILYCIFLPLFIVVEKISSTTHISKLNNQIKILKNQHSDDMKTLSECKEALNILYNYVYFYHNVENKKVEENVDIVTNKIKKHGSILSYIGFVMMNVAETLGRGKNE